jgi:hypothetical protein
MLRILFLGENWYGSCARACCYALRRLGCDVLDLDVQTYLPQLSTPSSRVALRIAERRLAEEYNAAVLRAARQFQPDLLLSFKGNLLVADTLRELRTAGVTLFNYYPDRMVFALGTPIADAIPVYDCVFDTKAHWDGNTAEHIKVRNRIFLPHGYDPEIHHPIALDERDVSQFGCDVSFVATHMPVKEEMLDALLDIRPNIDLRIWGNQWEKCRSKRLRARARGIDARGLMYSKIIAASRINLAIMGVTKDALDETTTRTYEIPAVGGFMLHQRSPELLELFDEGREVAAFGSARELVEKIDFYLAHPQERQAIALAGHRRCVPAYSYDVRMSSILDCYRRHYASPAAENVGEAAKSPVR